MSLGKYIGLAFVATLLTACVSTSYVPVGSKEQPSCLESNNCIIDTDNGEALVSVGKSSVVSVGVRKRLGSRSFDFLVTINNISDNPYYFDPDNVPYYDSEAVVASWEASKSFATAGALLMTALQTVAVTKTDNPYDFQQAQQAFQPSIDKFENDIEAKDKQIANVREEFMNTKLNYQTIQPGATVGGRVVITLPQDADTSVVELSVPVGDEVHKFQFKEVENKQS